MNTDLTPASLALFLRFAQQAPHWNGTPILDITAAERGNLTDLKKNGLIATFKDDGCDWVEFTEQGKQLAAQNGIEI